MGLLFDLKRDYSTCGCSAMFLGRVKVTKRQACRQREVNSKFSGRQGLQSQRTRDSIVLDVALAIAGGC